MVTTHINIATRKKCFNFLLTTTKIIFVKELINTNGQRKDNIILEANLNFKIYVFFIIISK